MIRSRSFTAPHVGGLGEDALRRTLWKHGMVRPELLRHTVNPDGSHTITLTLARGL
jgi:hypothetical protein